MDLPEGCNQDVSQAAGITKLDQQISTLKLTHEAVGKPQVLVDLGTKDFLSSLTASQTQHSVSCHVSLSVEQRATLLAAPQGE